MIVQTNENSSQHRVDANNNYFDKCQLCDENNHRSNECPILERVKKLDTGNATKSKSQETNDRVKEYLSVDENFTKLVKWMENGQFKQDQAQEKEQTESKKWTREAGSRLKRTTSHDKLAETNSEFNRFQLERAENYPRKLDREKQGTFESSQSRQ